MFFNGTALCLCGQNRISFSGYLANCIHVLRPGIALFPDGKGVVRGATTLFATGWSGSTILRNSRQAGR